MIVNTGTLLTRGFRLAGFRFLVGVEGLLPSLIFGRVERFSKEDRILEGEFGAGSDGEVGSVGSIAHQNHILVMPLLAVDTREVEPCRTAQVLGITHESLAI